MDQKLRTKSRNQWAKALTSSSAAKSTVKTALSVSRVCGARTRIMRRRAQASRGLAQARVRTHTQVLAHARVRARTHIHAHMLAEHKHIETGCALRATAVSWI